MDLKIPNQSDYSNKISKIQELLRVTVPGVSRAVGSVLYELLIRPVSIISSSIEKAFKDFYTKHSLKYLSSSANTEYGDADHILSNYFITRKTGSAAKGVITIYSTSEHTRIPSGALFSVSGCTIMATKVYHGIYPKADSFMSSDYEEFIDAYRVGDLYCFNIGVETQENTNSVIPAGIGVTAITHISGLDHATLVSPIEGGATGETDAQMIARAKYAICSWNGGSSSMHKILEGSGLPLYSSVSIDNDDEELCRTDGASLYIGTGGMVDTYVKTCIYPLGGSVSIDTMGTGKIDITDHLPSGVLSIDSVVGTSGTHYNPTISWGSSSPYMSDNGARFSSYQTVSIDMSSIPEKKVAIQYTYMPYIKELQEYISRDDVCPLGLDVVIKAAIPVVLDIRAELSGFYESSEIIESVRNFINSTTVGSPSIDISDINRYLIDNGSASHFINPTLITATSVDLKGRYTDIVYSDTGILKHTDTKGTRAKTKFFCISDNGVNFE